MKIVLVLIGIVVVGGILITYRGALLQVDIEEVVTQSDNTTQVAPAFEFEDASETAVTVIDGASEPEEPQFEPLELPQSPESPPVPVEEATKIAEWQNLENGWQLTGIAPECPNPLQFFTPTDLSLATSVLYPGQYRSGDYKPHGGFRYDTSQSDDITIVAPMDARVVDGARYLVDGEIQYSFDFIAPCGIWYRFGHLRELSPKFKAIAETFPKAVEGDSHTYGLNVVVTVTTGETIATAVGFKQDNNTFVDWGVYDLRSKNSASQDPVWAAQHTGQQAQNGVCWFDLLSSEDEQIVRSLPPGDGVSGATSDYCL